MALQIGVFRVLLVRKYRANHPEMRGFRDFLSFYINNLRLYGGNRSKFPGKGLAKACEV